MAGCGSKPASTQTSSETAEPGSASRAEESPPVEKEKPAAKSNRTAKAPSNQVGDVPLDVWPEVWLKNPLAVAAERGTPDATVAAVPAVAAAPAAAPVAAAEPAKAPGGSADWKTLLPIDDVIEETKKVRAHLNEALQSVSKYNGNYKDVIQVDGAVMAVLAQIMVTHPDSVTWKKDAKYVRDNAAEVARRAKGLGQASYDPTRQAYDNLDALLSGNKPGKLEEAAPSLPFSEVAARGPLMKRMDKAFQSMKSNVGNEDLLKKQADMVSHEATMLATLSKVAGTPTYASTDEEDYQKYVAEMLKASLEIVQAAKSQDFKSYTDALNRCQKACNDCHQNYRFADGG